MPFLYGYARIREKYQRAIKIMFFLFVGLWEAVIFSIGAFVIFRHFFFDKNSPPPPTHSYSTADTALVLGGWIFMLIVGVLFLFAINTGISKMVAKMKELEK